MVDFIIGFRFFCKFDIYISYFVKEYFCQIANAAHCLPFVLFISFIVEFKVIWFSHFERRTKVTLSTPVKHSHSKHAATQRVIATQHISLLFAGSASRIQNALAPSQENTTLCQHIVFRFYI